MQVGKLTWPSLNAISLHTARIYGKISRISLWAFDLRLGRGVNPNFQPRRVSLRLGFEGDIYKNICPDVTRKPWRVMSPDAEGRGSHNAPGYRFRVTESNKQSQMKWNTLDVDYSCRFQIPLLSLLCSATASLDLEPDLISMQNKYTRGWHNCILCDIV